MNRIGILFHNHEPELFVEDFVGRDALNEGGFEFPLPHGDEGGFIELVVAAGMDHFDISDRAAGDAAEGDGDRALLVEAPGLEGVFGGEAEFGDERSGAGFAVAVAAETLFAEAGAVVAAGGGVALMDGGLLAGLGSSQVLLRSTDELLQGSFH